jgi:hypothetical protein
MNPVDAAKALMAPRSLTDRADPPSETERESTTEAGDSGDGEGTQEQKANDSPV